MKLDDLNKDLDEIFNISVSKQARYKGKGNINKEKSTGDPDKTQLPYRSGNQYATATNDNKKKSVLGANDSSRDKQYPSNKVGLTN